MWRGGRRRGDAWSNRRTWAEKFGVDATYSDAPGGDAGGQFAHEGGRSADVEIAVARHAQFLENTQVQASGSVEIYA
jgi:hypothetical protein